MRIALVTFENESSWGIRSIAEYLRFNDLDVQLYFLERYKDILYDVPEVTLRSFIHDFKPCKDDVVGISFISSFINDAKKLAEMVHKKKATIVVGGVHPTILPEDCVSFADYIIRGTGEEAMLELLDLLKKGKKPRKGVYPKKNKFWFKEDITTILYPQYDTEYTMITKGKIVRTTKVPRRIGPFVKYHTFTSFGCPYSCSYCINPTLQKLSGRYGKKFIRKRSIVNIINELHHIRDKVDNIVFQDEDFLIDQNWMTSFLKYYKRRIDLPFTCFSTPATFKQINILRIIKKLKEANCISINLGIQSASLKTSKIFKRDFDKELLLKIAHSLSKEGIIPVYDIMMEIPFEDETDVSETIDTVLSLPRPFLIHVYYFTLFPGYIITKKMGKKGLKPHFDISCFRLNRKPITVETSIIQLAQVPFIPRKLLRFFYKNKSKVWSLYTTRLLAKTLKWASPARITRIFRGAPDHQKVLRRLLNENIHKVLRFKNIYSRKNLIQKEPIE